jgi:ATP adenylyltransferase
MQHLWSPWRSEYIQSFTETDATAHDNDNDNERKTPRNECFLCAAAQQPASDEETLVVARRETCFVIMNRFPYNSGHIMVAPLRHCGELSLLADAELTDLFFTAREAERALKLAFQPHGVNVGINIGKAAGAGVPDHLHVHLVPRWEGDVNFMPTIADVKVVSERLQDTFEKLCRAFGGAVK